MFEFVVLDPDLNNFLTFQHIYPTTNFSLSFLQRGHYNQSTQEFQSPPLELYTQFSLTTYFLVFWIILALQVLSIFIADNLLITKEKITQWKRFLHAIQKSSFPFPYTNWHQGNGTSKVV